MWPWVATITYHITRCFGLHCCHLHPMLVCYHLSRTQLNQTEIRGLTRPVKDVPPLRREKIWLGCMFGIVVLLNDGGPWNEFWFIWLNLNTQHAPLYLCICPAAAINHDFINKCQYVCSICNHSSLSHNRTITVFDSWGGALGLGLLVNWNYCFQLI